MRINNNLSSLNTLGRLATSQTNMSKSLEKLSSGIGIVRASDDAAGLTISEKMRGQIRGLKQAEKNAQQAISMLQTAEGALGESHSILQRMRELAVQASNDTTTAVDRGEIQKEITQLVDELDRISGQTEFNTKTLLNGSMGQTLSSDNTFSVTTGDNNAINALSVTSDTKAGSYSVDFNAVATRGKVTGTTPTGTLANGDWIKINDVRIDLTAADTRATIINKINAKTESTGVEAVHSDNGGIDLVNTAYGSKAISLQANTNAAADAAGLGTITTTSTTTNIGKDASATILGVSATVDSGNQVSLVANGVDANGLSVELKGYDTAASMTLSGLTTDASVASNLGTDEKLVINGTTIFDNGGTNKLTDKTLSGLMNAINAKTNESGVKASLDSSGQVVLTSTAKGDNANITISATNTTSGQVVLSKDITTNAVTTANQVAFTALDSDADVAALGTATETLSINGTAIVTATNMAAINTQAKLVDKINSFTSTTNVMAGLNDQNQIVLTSLDSNNIVLDTADAGNGFITGTPLAGTVTFYRAGTAGSDGLKDDITGNVTVGQNNAMTFQIGSNTAQTMTLGINDMTTKAIGKGVANASNLDNISDLKTEEGVSTASKAGDAVKVIDEAIKNVSAERSKLGAAQNRLEHTIGNLNTTKENMMAAESRMRDVDMAAEMSEFTKNQILTQASTAMLAQANQVPQGVLKLLG